MVQPETVVLILSAGRAFSTTVESSLHNRVLAIVAVRDAGGSLNIKDYSRRRLSTDWWRSLEGIQSVRRREASRSRSNRAFRLLDELNNVAGLFSLQSRKLFSASYLQHLFFSRRDGEGHSCDKESASNTGSTSDN